MEADATVAVYPLYHLKGSILVSTYHTQEFRSRSFKIDCLDMEHVYHVVSILFSACPVHSKSFDFYSTVLYFCYRRDTTDLPPSHFLELMMLTNSGLREAPPTRKPSTSGWRAIYDRDQSR